MDNPWPAAKIARLIELWPTGLSTQKIGLDLGTTKHAVVGKAHRLNLPPRPSPILPRDPTRPIRPRKIKAAPKVTLAPLVTPVEPPPPLPQWGQTHIGRIPCCWPMGDPKAPGFRFCDKPDVVIGKPYCPAHCAEAYRERVRDADPGGEFVLGYRAVA